MFLPLPHQSIRANLVQTLTHKHTYLLDPNRQLSKLTKRIHHQPGDPIVLHPRLTQFDYIGDKIDGVDGRRRMSGDELVERHWYKVHRESPTPATDQVPVLFRASIEHIVSHCYHIVYCSNVYKAFGHCLVN